MDQSFAQYWVSLKGRPPLPEETAEAAAAQQGFELGMRMREIAVEKRAFLEALCAGLGGTGCETEATPSRRQLLDLLRDYMAVDGAINTYSASALHLVRSRVRHVLGPRFPDGEAASARARALALAEPEGPAHRLPGLCACGQWLPCPAHADSPVPKESLP